MYIGIEGVGREPAELGGFPNELRDRERGDWIDGPIPEAHFEVEVGAGRTSGRADLADLLSRRHDLIETWYSILSVIHYPTFATRLKLLTWQELATTLPHDLQQFLDAKYGIVPTNSH